jgi:hypothetical protein
MMLPTTYLSMILQSMEIGKMQGVLHTVSLDGENSSVSPIGGWMSEPCTDTERTRFWLGLGVSRAGILNTLTANRLSPSNVLQRYICEPTRVPKGECTYTPSHLLPLIPETHMRRHQFPELSHSSTRPVSQCSNK